jgi:hypothetical protein
LADSARRFVMFAMVAMLAGCGGLPRPFEGRPGTAGALLSEPPPSRLAIPTPGTAMLTNDAAQGLTEALATALQARDVPAIAGPARKGDWWLAVTADLRGATVVPVFTVQNPQSEAKGSIDAAPVAPADWVEARPATLQAIAAAAAPRLATLLTAIEASRRQSDPTSLANRPVRVLLEAVTGAPGDGNQSLTRQMKLELTNLGQQVLDTPQTGTQRPDYTVSGHVATELTASNQMRVEVVWTVTDARHTEAGKVAQLNEVPRGSLNGLWADVAVVVAQEAAGGVRDVILNQTGARKPDAPKTEAPAAK